MLTGIFNLLIGYHEVEVYGHFAPRLLNLAAIRGVYVWNVRRVDETLTALCVSIRGLKRLTQNMPKGVKIQVIRSHGLPFVIKRYSHRRALLAGPVLAAALMFAATRFIWRVDIDCPSAALGERVRQEIALLGVRPFALKSGFKSSDVKREMILRFDDIAWLWVELRGSRAIVRVEPRTLPPEVLDTEAATDVVARVGGVITSVSATAGTPTVKIGDTVDAGQVLISSMGKVHARGEVFARVWYERSAAIPKKREVKTPTGRATQILGARFKKKYIKISLNSSILYPKYDRIQKENNILGIKFVKDTYYEIKTSYEPNDASAEAERFAAECAKALSGDIIAQRTEENESFVLVWVTIERTERIDWERNLDGSVL